MIIFISILLLINLYFIIQIWRVIRNVYFFRKLGISLDRESFYIYRGPIMSDSTKDENKKDCTIISREYLNYSCKGSEKDAINIINRDYNMNEFLRQIRQYSL